MKPNGFFAPYIGGSCSCTRRWSASYSRYPAHLRHASCPPPESVLGGAAIRSPPPRKRSFRMRWPPIRVETARLLACHGAQYLEGEGQLCALSVLPPRAPSPAGASSGLGQQSASAGNTHRRRRRRKNRPSMQAAAVEFSTSSTSVRRRVEALHRVLLCVLSSGGRTPPWRGSRMFSRPREGLRAPCWSGAWLSSSVRYELDVQRLLEQLAPVHARLGRIDIADTG